MIVELGVSWVACFPQRFIAGPCGSRVHLRLHLKCAGVSEDKIGLITLRMSDLRKGRGLAWRERFTYKLDIKIQ